jgi:hypothetical protein
VKKADAVFAAGLGFRTIGVATEDILSGQKGYVTTQGFVRGIDTTAFPVAGVPAYLAPGGGLQAAPPTPPDITYLVGIVTKENHATELCHPDIDTEPGLSLRHDRDHTGR